MRLSNSLKKNIAILFINMGGPECREEVPFFLKRLFSDKELFPLGILQSPIASIFSKSRTVTVQEKYSFIQGYSPLKRYTTEQCVKVCAELQKKQQSIKFYPFTAYSYSDPSIKFIIERITTFFEGTVILFPQYPQFSFSTTGSVLKTLGEEIKIYEDKRIKNKEKPKIDWRLIDRWYNNKMFHKAWASKILNKISEKTITGSRYVIVFSAHSTPLSFVEKGDPYSLEVAMTMIGIMNEVGVKIPYFLSWQSKVGYGKWISPSTVDVVSRLSKKKEIDKIIIVPISFTSDHFETLYELDIELKQKCKNPGKIERVQSLNVDPLFIKALANEIQHSFFPKFKSLKQLEYNYILSDKKLVLLNYLKQLESIL